MNPPLPPATAAASRGRLARRLADKAWRLLHLEPAASLALAERALQRAGTPGEARHDAGAAAWALLVRGLHRLYFATPAEAMPDLDAARGRFAALGERAGELLALAGVARATWRSGRVHEAMQMLLPLRDEGVARLHHEQRGVLLNAIAGCYSALGRSEEAFAYMYQALREAGPERGYGFDTVLRCNLSHELMQLGDYDEALAQVERGLASRGGMRNARLLSVLLINQVVCLTELGRADEARPVVQQLLALPVGEGGRGRMSLCYETLAIAALRAGDSSLGADLVARALACSYTMLADERVELAVARALLAVAGGDPAAGLERLREVAALVDGADDDSASLRVRCLHAQLASELHEALADPVAALHAMRRWQRLNTQRARLASRARYQAAALQTELLTLQHRLEENDARRRATERARAELAAANRELTSRIAEVQALQEALRQQATQDALTGLANRRHLNETLPALLALALRERQPLAVVVVDLDHFKRVNDEHGHAAGDCLLAAFGRLLRDRLRSSDQAFRYGGEEFCLLMPHTAAVAARRKVEELLAGWGALRFELDRAVLHGQSFSAGVADTTHAPLSPDGLLQAADQLLLAAKRAGRARVHVHEGVAEARR
jgi:diguanylate cyclase (GGDEF)-like protein